MVSLSILASPGLSWLHMNRSALLDVCRLFNGNKSYKELLRLRVLRVLGSCLGHWPAQQGRAHKGNERREGWASANSYVASATWVVGFVRHIVVALTNSRKVQILGMNLLRVPMSDSWTCIFR